MITLWLERRQGPMEPMSCYVTAHTDDKEVPKLKTYDQKLAKENTHFRLITTEEVMFPKNVSAVPIYV